MLALLAAGTVVAFGRRGGVAWVLVLAYKLAVTVAFYGYARQAASIAPALFALVALGADWACGVAAERIAWRPGARAARAAAVVAVAALAACAAWTAWQPMRFELRIPRPDGHVEFTPEWGPGSFEYPEWLLLLPPGEPTDAAQK